MTAFDTDDDKLLTLVPDHEVGTRDLAVVQLKAPKKVTLKAGTLPKPGKVSVTIANLGTLTETFPTMQSVLDVVSVTLESLGTNCVAPTAVLQPLKSTSVGE